ncbi:Uncharacterised protein [Enterobacter cloacae]|nr:Uncharacterised protein [Enterobacter cloacae]
MLDGVDHIIARHGVHTQARQIGVDSNIALSGAAVAHIVGYAGAHRQFAVAQRRQIGFRYVDRPGEIALHRGRVRVAAQRHGHGIARFGIHHGTADGLPGCQLRRVNDVVTRDGIDDHARQNGFHVHGVRDTGTVANAVRG